MTINEIKNYLKKNLIKFDGKVLTQIKNFKSDFIQKQQENDANEMWRLENVYKIKSKYIDAYNNIFNCNYEESWRELEQIEILLSFVFENSSPEFFNEYKLDFIRKNVFAFQELYPYELFASRESVITEEICSICGKKVSLRNNCGHVPGKLYMGELCYRNVKKFELKAIAIVRNPFDKYAVLTPEGKEYNYLMLEELKKNIKGPYEKITVITEMEKLPQYKNVGRNDKCPCGSGIKYKKCCLGTNRELFKHKIIIFDHQMKPTKTKLFNTYKN